MNLIFTNLQREILKVFALNINEKELLEVKNYLSEKFSDKINTTAKNNETELYLKQITEQNNFDKYFTYISSEKSLEEDWLTEENKVWDTI